MELLIVEKSGWSKSIKTDRAVTRVGSAPSNDIQLQSPKIASVQLQILHSTDMDSRCKVVNLAHEITAKISGEIRRLPACAAVDVHDGDEILLDDYSIAFRLPLSANVMQSTRMIQATLSFADAVLRPTFATTGVLTLKNAGEHSACQFRVDIEGLPADCFQIDPIPLMYSGAQEEVQIRIFHRIHYPPAGLQTMVVKISAPESYSGEELIIRQDIYVTPVFKQALELFDDLRAAAEKKDQQELISASGGIRPASDAQDHLPSANLPVAAPTEVSASNPIAPREPAELPASEQVPPLAARPGPEISRVKVVRAPRDEDEDSTQMSEALSTITPAEVFDNASPERPPDGPAQKQALPVASRPVPDVSKLKVVRERSDGDDFWDEK